MSMVAIVTAINTDIFMLSINDQFTTIYSESIFLITIPNGIRLVITLCVIINIDVVIN